MKDMTPQEHAEAEVEERAELDNLVNVLGNERAQELAAVDAIDMVVKDVEREYAREVRQ